MMNSSHEGPTAALAMDRRPVLDLDADCLMLDFDGTLVPLADRPDAVRLAETTRDDLIVIHRRLNGAVAIITGRSIGEIDYYLEPLKLPVSGVHGLTRRAASGRTEMVEVDDAVVAGVVEELHALVHAVPGLLLEAKWGAVALHYRNRPELAQRCFAAVREAAMARSGKVELIRGKMVVEAKFATNTKGSAIDAFMSEPPFQNRRPVFVGDDITDEDGFAAVEKWGGVGAKVGHGQSVARCRFDDTRAFLDWFGHYAREAKCGDAR